MKTNKIFGLLIVLILISTVAFAAVDCNKLVNDEAGVLGNNLSQVEMSAQRLNARGADTHILAINMHGQPTMDAYVADMVRACPSWQSPNKGVKSTLVVIAVAPRERKFGLYSGQAFSGAFDQARMNKY